MIKPESFQKCIVTDILGNVIQNRLSTCVIYIISYTFQSQCSNSVQQNAQVMVRACCIIDWLVAWTCHICRAHVWMSCFQLMLNVTHIWKH